MDTNGWVNDLDALRKALSIPGVEERCTRHVPAIFELLDDYGFPEDIAAYASQAVFACCQERYEKEISSDPSAWAGEIRSGYLEDAQRMMMLGDFALTATAFLLGDEEWLASTPLPQNPYIARISHRQRALVIPQFGKNSFRSLGHHRFEGIITDRECFVRMAGYFDPACSFLQQYGQGIVLPR
ncbi:hypothetical protein J4460_06180 [Candidatus Woesearchaeota archaeon]|nr:hypothetical protein [Candidatus Woesearchaeota archaeon]HIH37584.1 hypothetical protein [Candidatus Woesearchaeota archaeon]HIH47997.1 hypothetical protein [Candidatus Woesearchaeota archaeon]HIJ03675.1 hypothetical protein [Candidatus Woesearchaeota archaeon]